MVVVDVIMFLFIFDFRFLGYLRVVEGMVGSSKERTKGEVESRIRRVFVDKE